jgi:hypothetical protein
MKIMKNLNKALVCLLLTSIFMLSCQKEKIVFETYDHRAFLLDTMAGKRGTVYIFLAPECPLSENYTLTINQLQAQFVDFGLQFYAVISGKLYDSVAIRDYANRFPLTLPLLVDTGYYFSDQFKATTTPEAVLLNEKSEVVYQGAIDNWATALTRLTAAPTSNYLMDAMNSVLKKQAIKISKTKAVGCFIER